MNPWFKVSVYGLVAGSTAGCGTEPTCTDDILPAVVVEIRDAFEGTPLAENARGVIREGEFVDSCGRGVGSGMAS